MAILINDSNRWFHFACSFLSVRHVLLLIIAIFFLHRVVASCGCSNSDSFLSALVIPFLLQSTRLLRSWSRCSGISWRRLTVASHRRLWLRLISQNAAWSCVTRSILASILRWWIHSTRIAHWSSIRSTCTGILELKWLTLHTVLTKCAVILSEILDLLLANCKLCRRYHWVIWQFLPTVRIHLIVQRITRILRDVLHLIHRILAICSSKLHRKHISRLHLTINLLLVIHEWISDPLFRLLHRLLLHLGCHYTRISLSVLPGPWIAKGLLTLNLAGLSKHARVHLVATSIVHINLSLESTGTDLFDLLILDSWILLLKLTTRSLYLSFTPTILDFLK